MHNTSIVDRVSLIPEDRWLYSTTIVVPLKPKKTRDETRVLRLVDIFFRSIVRKHGAYNGLENIGSNHVLSLSTLQYRPSDQLLHVHGHYSALWSLQSLSDVYGTESPEECIRLSSEDLEDELKKNRFEIDGVKLPIVHCFAEPYQPKLNAWTKYITRDTSSYYLSTFAMKVIKQRQKQQKKNEKVVKHFERIYTNG